MFCRSGFVNQLWHTSPLPSCYLRSSFVLDYTLMQINFCDFLTGNRFLIWKSSYGDKFLFEKYEISFQITLTPMHCSMSLFMILNLSSVLVTVFEKKLQLALWMFSCFKQWRSTHYPGCRTKGYSWPFKTAFLTLHSEEENSIQLSKLWMIFKMDGWPNRHKFYSPAA